MVAIPEKIISYRHLEFASILRFTHAMGVRMTQEMWDRSVNSILLGKYSLYDYQEKMKEEIDNYCGVRNEL